MSSRWAGVNESPNTPSAAAIWSTVTGRGLASDSGTASGGAPGAARCAASGAGSAATGRPTPAASVEARKRRRLGIAGGVGR